MDIRLSVVEERHNGTLYQARTMLLGREAAAQILVIREDIINRYPGKTSEEVALHLAKVFFLNLLNSK